MSFGPPPRAAWIARTTRSQHAAHLVQRFFGHVRARGLSPTEQQRVHDHLDDAGAVMFWAQGPADQRHAFEVAGQVAAQLPDDQEAYTAALLHDVGKRHAGLGAVRRSIATVLDGAGFPLPDPMRRYRNHGSIGAEELATAGYDGIVVAFAEHHPGPAPEGIDRERWAVLLAADG